MEILRILRNIREIKKNMTLSKEEIKNIQNSKLEKIIEHALRHSKFYREYYGKNGINIDNFRDIPFENYPVINKEIFKENFNDIICVDDITIEELEKFVSQEKNWCKKYNQKYVVITSSGSTGSPTIFVYDKKAWSTVKALSVVRTGKRLPMEILRKHKASFVGATHGSFAAVTLAKDMEMANYSVITLDANNPIYENIKILNEFQPEILIGYSSSISELASEKLNGKLSISPEKIICSADPLTLEKRNIIKQAFGIEPVNFYAASESLAIASQIPGRDDMFIFDDFYKVEIVDKFHNEVPPGKIGSIILTNLFNYTMPLIKYEIEDQLKKSSNQDYNFTLVDEIVGRVVENIIFEKKDGSKTEIHGLQLAGLYFKGVKKIQFIQEDRRTLLMKYVGRDDPEVQNEILKNIKDLLGRYELEKDITLKLERVSEIPSDHVTEKYKAIIPYKN